MQVVAEGTPPLRRRSKKINKFLVNKYFIPVSKWRQSNNL
jgi:hypothetical protein